MANLVEGIISECNRAREVLSYYKEIGPAGMFGAAMIEAKIREGEAALASGEVVRMMQAYQTLKDIEA